MIQGQLLTSNDRLTHDQYHDRHSQTVSREMADPRSNGGFIKMMGCPRESCDGLCWKNRRMNTIFCGGCGLEVDSHHEGDVKRETPTLDGGETPIHGDGGNSPAKYDGSGLVRLFGGTLSAYEGDGEYEFGDMEDSLLETTVSASD